MDSSMRQAHRRGVSRGLGWLGAASGLVYLALSMVGNSMATAGEPDVLASGGELAAYYKAHSGPQVAVGIGAEFLGFLALVVFLAYLHRVLRDAEGEGAWLATAALGGGLLTVAIKLASYGSIWAPLARRDVLSAEAAQTLTDLGWGAFVASWFTWGIFVLAASTVALRTGVLPRVLGWLGLLLGVGCVAAVMVSTASPAAAGAAVAPFLLSGLWLGAVSVVLLRRAARAPVPLGEPAMTGH